MSINSIVNQYCQFSQNEGISGDGGSVQVSYNDDILTFTEADGDSYTFNASNLGDYDIEMLSSALGVEVTQGTEETDNDDARLGELGDDAEQKEGQIKSVSEEIKNIFDETLEEQEEITKNEYLRILDVVDDSVAQFMAARENGEDVDFSDLNSTIMAGVEDSTYEDDIAAVFGNLETANTKIGEMLMLLQGYSSITEEAKTIDEARMAELADSGVSEESLEMEQALSLSFQCSNFFEVYQEKLDGHKQQYDLISDFEELDDSIIQMYTEYAGSVSTTVQELLSKQEADDSEETEEIEETDETETVGSDEEEYDDEEDEEAKAA